MRIEGTLRANLLAAIASARRLRGAVVHSDTEAYWARLAEYGRRNSTQPVGELVAELETELAARTCAPAPAERQQHKKAG